MASLESAPSAWRKAHSQVASRYPPSPTAFSRLVPSVQISLVSTTSLPLSLILPESWTSAQPTLPRLQEILPMYLLLVPALLAGTGVLISLCRMVDLRSWVPLLVLSILAQPWSCSPPMPSALTSRQLAGLLTRPLVSSIKLSRSCNLLMFQSKPRSLDNLFKPIQRVVWPRLQNRFQHIFAHC